MSNWKNVSGAPLTVEMRGPGNGLTEVAVDGVLTLADDMDYLVGSQLGEDQVSKVAVDGKPEAKAK